jgi:hypothetical protein
MSRQALGNAVAGVLFLIVAIYDFTQDDSGIGVVFVDLRSGLLRPSVFGHENAAPLTRS